MILQTRAPRLRARLLYTRYPHFGAHTGFIQLARHLDPARIDAAAVPVSDGDDDFPIRSTRVRDRLRDRIRRGGVAWYKLSDLWAEARTLGACAARELDVVHFLDGEHGPQFLPKLLRRARPLVGRAHTVATFHQPPEMLDQLLDRHVVADLDFVTVVSPTQAEWFRTILPDERVEVVLHGVDADYFTPAAGRECEPAEPDAPFRCITVGHWLRDWSTLRAVAERLAGERGIEFHVVTSRPTGLDGLPNVHHHQGLSDDALRDMYRSADVAFLPLTGATANNTLLESLACGLPVLSTALPSVRAYVPDGEAVLVDDNDPDAFVDALRALRDDRDALRARARAARARAEVLSWKRISGRFLSIYERFRT